MIEVAQLARDEGIVLRTQDHAETDRIAVVLTPNHGRLDLLAKGARRMEQAAGAALDVLNVVKIIYYRRRSGLHLLKEVELVRTFPGIRSDLDRATTALGGIEWALALIPTEAPDERVHRLTVEFLTALDAGHPPRVLALGYVLRLLAVAGHRPHLDGCLSCGAQDGLTWSPERGGLLCRPCGGSGEAVSPRVWRTLGAIARLPLPALARLRVEETDLERGEALVRGFREAQLRP